MHLFIGSYVLVVSNGKLCRIHFNDMFSSYFLVYSAFDVKKVLANKQKVSAQNFVIVLIFTIFLSYIVVFQILPIIEPKLLQ